MLVLRPGQPDDGEQVGIEVPIVEGGDGLLLRAVLDQHAVAGGVSLDQGHGGLLDAAVQVDPAHLVGVEGDQLADLDLAPVAAGELWVWLAGRGRVVDELLDGGLGEGGVAGGAGRGRGMVVAQVLGEAGAVGVRVDGLVQGRAGRRSLREARVLAGRGRVEVWVGELVEAGARACWRRLPALLLLLVHLEDRYDGGGDCDGDGSQ